VARRSPAFFSLAAVALGCPLSFEDIDNRSYIRTEAMSKTMRMLCATSILARAEGAIKYRTQTLILIRAGGAGARKAAVGAGDSHPAGGGGSIPLFKPDECANYFAAAGYEPD
jgi:hypothetical protein